MIGKIYRYDSFGESHGPMIGCVIHGVPSNVPLDIKDIQRDLDLRRPGQNQFVTARQEEDRVEIVSGVFEGKTTGTPLCMLIHNNDARSKDYSHIKNLFRPGHADYSYAHKYGHRDYRGGGRSSARETAMRVAAGSVAMQILRHKMHPDFDIASYVAQIGQHPSINATQHAEEIDMGDGAAIKELYHKITKSPFFTCDPTIEPVWEDYLMSLKQEGDSVGARLGLVAGPIPPGLGEPVIDKLDADLAKAFMSINAAKSVYIGGDMGHDDVAFMTGKSCNDQMQPMSDNDAVHYKKSFVCQDLWRDHLPVARFNTNHHGGVLGGISTGANILATLSFKPTSSVQIAQEMLGIDGKLHKVHIDGRHDPCVGIRAVPIMRAMAAIMLCDHFLRQRAVR